jgi:hypothetical protein
MAPQLRSSSRATSNTSHPSAPLDASVAAVSSSYSEYTRPRKQRKTGRDAGIGVYSAQEAERQEQGVGPTFGEQGGQPGPSNAQENSQSQGDTQEAPITLDQDTWVESPLRPPMPSYKDYCTTSRSIRRITSCKRCNP